MLKTFSELVKIEGEDNCYLGGGGGGGLGGCSDAIHQISHIVNNL